MIWKLQCLLWSSSKWGLPRNASLIIGWVISSTISAPNGQGRVQYGARVLRPPTSDTASTQESGVPKRQFEGPRLAAQPTSTMPNRSSGNRSHVGEGHLSGDVKDINTRRGAFFCSMSRFLLQYPSLHEQDPTELKYSLLSFHPQCC
jgi:hypothetical protein